MAIRVHVLATLMALGSAGCVTTTAHRLPIKDNPMSQQAIACETKCRGLLKPPGPPDCRPTPEGWREPCRASPEEGGDAYAACLDRCPGATAIDGAPCEQTPDAICRETIKPNWGGIAGGAAGGVAVGTVVLTFAAIAALGSAPILLIILLAGS